MAEIPQPGPAIEWFSGTFEEQVVQATEMALASVEEAAVARQSCPGIRTQNDLQLVINRAIASMEDVSEELANGEVTLIDWQIEMRNLALSSYVCAGVMAFGGWANIDSTELAIIASIAAVNFVYLQRYAFQIEGGQYPLYALSGEINGNFIERSRHYARAARNVFWETDRVIKRDREGRTFLRSVRNALDSCNGCIEQENLGIMPIDDPRIVPIGSRDCLRKCLCEYQYFTAEEAAAELSILPGAVAL